MKTAVDSVLVCGVDEAGRGPLAGPVHAAAVILDRKRRINGLADSKVLTAERREVLAARIKERAIAWAVASASVEEIDRINIFHASMLAMRRAVEQLGVCPDETWVDGNHFPDLGCKGRAIVDGDALHPVISAASIIAKTTRDAEMCALHERYPQYGFDRHKGYATAEHLDALGRVGPCEIHRRSFYPVGVFFQKDLFSEAWGGMAESLRVRTYRLYCEAKKLSEAPALELGDFDKQHRLLKRRYADVIASKDASPHVEIVVELLRKARAQLKTRAPG
ncbi:MAG: ribonuclease HII [Betaproteobacteria bacterium]|nr:MAG: ribonuclease HII [Betaproteobacteria bacterium]